MKLLLLALGSLPLLAFAARSPQANRALTEIRSLNAAGYVLSGQQIGYEPFIATDLTAKAAGESEYTHIRRLTGQRPAILSFDWDLCFTYPDRRKSLIALAISHARAGGLVSFSWHEASPRVRAPDAPAPNNAFAKLTAAEWNDLLNVPASAIHQNWLFHVRTIASYLRQLQDAGVPVLWRPYHESEGDFFWWGNYAATSAANYRALWRMLYQELAGPQRLTNLIWIWASAYPEIPGFYPGDASVDIGGVDDYSSDTIDVQYGFRFDRVKTDVAAGNRPVAFTEVGLLPDPSVLFQVTHPAWVNVWFGDYLDRDYYGNARPDGNTATEVRAFYADPRVATLATLAAKFPAKISTERRRLVTTRAKVTLRGHTTGPAIRVVATLRGQKRPLRVRGLAAWKITVPLHPGKNLVTVRVKTSAGKTPAPLRIRIVRKSPPSG